MEIKKMKSEIEKQKLEIQLNISPKENVNSMNTTNGEISKVN